MNPSAGSHIVRQQDTKHFRTGGTTDCVSSCQRNCSLTCSLQLIKPQIQNLLIVISKFDCVEQLSTAVCKLCVIADLILKQQFTDLFSTVAPRHLQLELDRADSRWDLG